MLGIPRDQIDELLTAATGLLLAFGSGIGWLSRQRQASKASERADAAEREAAALRERVRLLERDNADLVDENDQLRVELRDLRVARWP
jgi:hypothetical protein